jgi:hypothetical protein
MAKTRNQALAFTRKNRPACMLAQVHTDAIRESLGAWLAAEDVDLGTMLYWHNGVDSHMPLPPLSPGLPTSMRSLPSAPDSGPVVHTDATVLDAEKEDEFGAVSSGCLLARITMIVWSLEVVVVDMVVVVCGGDIGIGGGGACVNNTFPCRVFTNGMPSRVCTV